jgi:L-alanine-DL-glutamate epimerase-like enolase superfamily enzyme
MRASLHRADLSYSGGLVLHTAASGHVPTLAELYLRLDDGESMGIGEVRANIAYLNGLEVADVVAGAEAALRTIDWRRDPAALLADVHEGGAVPLPPVRMLVDVALHDLAARRAGVSVATAIGAAGPDVAWRTNQTLFWSPFDDFLARAEAYVARGFCDLKVRVAVGDFAEDLQRLDTLRARFGADVTIAADANGAWSPAEALDRLKAMAAFDLAYVEQPVAPGDWAAIDRLAAQSPMPVMLDESVATPDDVTRICGYGGRVFAHLKLVKLGGIAPTLAAARQLAAAGVPVMVGQMNESACATAAALHVACAVKPAFAELYGADGLVNDPARGLVYDAGWVRGTDGAGLGIAFDPAATRLVGEVHLGSV